MTTLAWYTKYCCIISYIWLPLLYGMFVFPFGARWHVKRIIRIPCVIVHRTSGAYCVYGCWKLKIFFLVIDSSDEVAKWKFYELKSRFWWYIAIHGQNIFSYNQLRLASPSFLIFCHQVHTHVWHIRDNYVTTYAIMRYVAGRVEKKVGLFFAPTMYLPTKIWKFSTSWRSRYIHFEVWTCHHSLLGIEKGHIVIEWSRNYLWLKSI